MPWVHNTTDRAPVGTVRPVSLTIAGHQLRPGKSAFVPEEKVTRNHRKLHGTALWIGELKRHPGHTVRPDFGGTPAELLHRLSTEELIDLCARTSPAITPSKNREMTIIRLLRRIENDVHSLDPEAFFFLDLWVKTSDRSYMYVGPTQGE